MCCPTIFDVKMEDFCRKAGLLAGGHMTKAPANLTYTSVMSHNTMHVALLVAVLTKWAADILNAYITAPSNEKIWTTPGKESGDDCGWKVMIVQALYGLKSSSAAFRAYRPGVCAR
ncbi:LOW QUALITY PROTEIN: hypothetical protein ACHAW6_003850 [Cyclotella cf. meneghiniana]